MMLFAMVLFSCETSTHDKQNNSKADVHVATAEAFLEDQIESDSTSDDSCKYSVAQYKYILDTNFLSTGAKVYWATFCDSIVLYFETSSGVKTKLNDNQMSIDYLDRLGESFGKEYRDYALFIQRVISGCCTPPNILFRDKHTGRIMDTIYSGYNILYDYEHDILISYIDDNYDQIRILKLKQNESLRVRLPKKLFKYVLMGDFVEPNLPYEMPIYKNNRLYLPYRYGRDDNNNWLRDTIVIRI